MTRNNFLVLAAGAALFAAALSRHRGGAIVLPGQPAPDFRLAGINGQTVSLSEYRGKTVLLNFWATWCPDCRDELPALEALQKRHKAAGFEIVAPSVDSNGRAALLPFLAQHALPYTVLLADPTTARTYGVNGIPSSFLIAPDGTVVRHYIGPVEPSELENDILKVLPRRRS